MLQQYYFHLKSIFLSINEMIAALLTELKKKNENSPVKKGTESNVFMVEDVGTQRLV